MHLFVCFLIVLFLGCLFESKDTTGTVDDTHTGVAMILHPDSTPATEAIIKIFAVNDTSRIPEKQTATDSEGRFSFEGLAKGSYNVMAEKEDLAAFQDSVVVSEDTVFFEQEILGDPKTVSGFVGLQPHHDPRTVTVQALGTDKYSNVDKDGMFTLSDMAVGEYSLRLVTTLPNYTPTFAPLVIEPSSPDTLADTLELLYTGIPVVTGLSASYDTLAGVVTLTWDAADFSNLQEYLVFRQRDTALGVNETPLGATEDTVYIDTVFPGDMDSEMHYADTNSYDFEYRVKVRDATDKIGENFGFVSARAVSPAKVRTTAEFEVLNLEYQESLDSNESIKVAVHLKNPTRAPATQLSWFDREADSLLREVSFESEENRVSDTLVFPFEFNFTKQLGISFIDGNGLEWDYSLDLNAPELPVIDSANSVKAYEIFEVPPAVQGTDWRYSAVNLPDWISLDSLTGRLHGKPENSDTGSYEEITLLATDGKLASRSPGFSIEVLKNPWVPVDSLITPRIHGTCNVVNDIVYVVGGVVGDQQSDHVEVYDPVINKWTEVAPLPFLNEFYKTKHISGVVNGKLYVMGGRWNGTNEPRDYFSIHEYDPVEDTWATKNRLFYVASPSATVYEDKIYIFGGLPIDTASGDFDTQDPVAVSLAYDPILDVMDTLAPMPMPRYKHASILWEEKIYVIGGTDSTEIPTGSIIMYDPESDSWESSNWPDFPVPAYGRESAVVSGGRIYVFAETFEGDIAFAYDPVTGGDWVAVRGGPLNDGQEPGKEYQAYCGLGETILAVGGIEDNAEFSSSVYRYYPALDE